LGSNKTEHAIITVSKAAPVIQDMSKIKGVLLIPSKFKNALPSFLVQRFNLMTSLKIIMTSSLKTFSYGLTACSLH
jgi:hypothetical protein